MRERVDLGAFPGENQTVGPPVTSHAGEAGTRAGGLGSSWGYDLPNLSKPLTSGKPFLLSCLHSPTPP